MHQIFFIYFHGIYFEKIIYYSQTTLKVDTKSIARKNNLIFFNIPVTLNLIFQVLPLIIITLLLGLTFTPLNISYAIFLVYIVIIDFLSLLYLAFNFYNNINIIIKNINNSDFVNYNCEFTNLMFKINSVKQLYNDYIINLQNIGNIKSEKEHLASIEILRRTVDAKDSYTRGHSDTLSEYCVLIGEKLGLSIQEINTLKIGGLFHDIGKIGIPDNILLKTEKLTNDEYEEIKKHPSIGAYILESSSTFEDIIPIVLYHHERYDGFGYPRKLKGKNIPLLARIVAVADSFDAMASKRAYRNSLPLDIIRLEFEKCKRNSV